MRKKSYFYGTTVVAGFLAVASIAFACTNYVGGKLTITGDKPGTSVTIGSGLGMGLLGGPAICSVTGTANASSVGGTVTLTVTSAADPGPAGSCPAHTLDPNASQLPAGTYGVTYLNQFGFNKTTVVTPSRGMLADCMQGVGSQNVHMGAVSVGSMTINASGNGGPSTYNLPPSTPNTAADEAGICISDSSGANGIMGPVNIVL